MSNFPFGAPLGYGGGPGPGQGYGAPAPMPGSVAAQPMLGPPSLSDYAANAPAWARLQAYLPEVTMPVGRNIGIQERDYVANWTFTSTTAQAQNLQFSQPSTIYAMTAAAVDTSGTITANLRNPLDLFRVQLTRINGDRFQTASALGSTIFGTGTAPRLIGPSGWMFDIGGTLRIDVTPLISTLIIDMVFWTLEVRGPSNFVWQAVPFGYVTG